MPNLKLTVDGRDYEGWQSVSITRGIDRVAGAFRLTVSDRWKDDGEDWTVLPGAACAVSIDGETVLSGFVDSFAPSFNASRRTITLQGRDKAADLVDCSVQSKSVTWVNTTLGKFAAEIAAPFGVKVTDESGETEPFRLISLQPTEKAHAAIARYAEMRGVLVMSDGRGGIKLTRPSTRQAAVQLVQGQNILAASGSIDHSKRFNEYTVTGQTFGNDALSGEAAAHLTGTAKDASIRATRKLRIIAQQAVMLGDAGARAEYENTVRAAGSQKITVTVQGWQQTEGGQVWAPNLLVQLRAPWLQVKTAQPFLIEAVALRKSEEGSTAELTLVRPDAYTRDPGLREDFNPFGADND